MTPTTDQRTAPDTASGAVPFVLAGPDRGQVGLNQWLSGD